MESFFLPCGYIPKDEDKVYKQVDLREMTGHEEDLLADKTRLQNNTALDEVLSRCIAKLGPLERAKPEARDKFFMSYLQDLTMSDRTFLVIRLRQLSLGPEFAFQMACPHCKHNHPRLMVNLESLTVKEMDDPAEREKKVTLPSKKTAVLRMLTGADEAKLRQLSKSGGTEFFTTVLRLRLAELDGEKSPSVAKIKGLSMRDRDFLRGQADAMEGGIDSQIELTCESCGGEWTSALPVGDKGFFFPSGIGM